MGKYNVQIFERNHGANPIDMLAIKINGIVHAYPPFKDDYAQAVVIVAGNKPHFAVLPQRMVKETVRGFRSLKGKENAVAFAAYVSHLESPENGEPFFKRHEYYGVFA